MEERALALNPNDDLIVVQQGEVLTGLSGARDEVLLTATAQNLRRLVKFLCRPPPLAAQACPA